MKDKEWSNKEIIAIFVILAVSILVGIASNYIGGIITFLVLGLIAAVTHIQMRAHKKNRLPRSFSSKKNPVRQSWINASTIWVAQQ
jgi:F0F1-type ATP synthase assembly protein I